jgi:beta-lactamase superfamily II metal-dependent hydrolase
VWDDFRTHYANELNHAATVQVPHHGAAPKAGPRFFNAGLLPEPGMRAVISVGTTNTYGHPTTQVINQAFAQQARLEIVTEESWLGFHEWFGFEL